MKKRFMGKYKKTDTTNALKQKYPDNFEGEHVYGDLVVKPDGQPFIMLSCIGIDENISDNNFVGTAVFVEKESVSQFIDDYWYRIKP